MRKKTYNETNLINMYKYQITMCLYHTYFVRNSECQSRNAIFNVQVISWMLFKTVIYSILAPSAALSVSVKRLENSIEIRAWVSNYTHITQWNRITHPLPSFSWV